MAGTVGSNLVVLFLLRAVWGALWGLIPFILGMFFHKLRLGQLGLLCCALTALLHTALPAFAAVGFSIAVFVKRGDLPGSGGRAAAPAPTPAPGGNGCCLTCVSGPLRGQTYRIDAKGLTIGCGAQCGLRFPAGSPGVSQRHCALQWRNGALLLQDLGSSYGTFLADGRRLPPEYPVSLTAGSRFYLGSPNCMFQITRL